MDYKKHFFLQPPSTQRLLKRYEEFDGFRVEKGRTLEAPQPVTESILEMRGKLIRARRNSRPTYFETGSNYLMDVDPARA